MINNQAKYQVSNMIIRISSQVKYRLRIVLIGCIEGSFYASILK